MRDLRLDGIFIGTALALVLSAPGFEARAQQSEPMTDAAIAAQVPTPNLTDTLAPPTAADVASPTAEKVDQAGEARAPEPPATAAAPAAAPAPAPAVARAEAAPKPADVDALVPMPQLTDDLPPPSAADVRTNAPAAEPAPAAPQTAAVPAAPIAPTASAAVDAQSQAIAAKLQELLGSKPFERMVTSKKERAAIQDFYQGRAYAPLWTQNGALTSRAKGAVAGLHAAAAEGLDPADYKIPDLAATDPAAAAEAEIRFTSTVLTYARHLQSGRTDPARISSNIEYRLPMPDPSDVLARVSGSEDMAKTFASFEPPHAGYELLKQKLAQLRGTASDAPPVHIAEGKTLKLAKKKVQDPRVPALRERLGLSADPADTTYDAELAEAVKTFQRDRGLTANGQLNRDTVEALNGQRKDRKIGAIVASMERWRWLPRDLGQMYVMINIPDYTLKVVRDDKVVWHTRIVTGKPATPTPIFSAQIENILVNPTWHVPDSITYGEYLPALRQDPTVLKRMGLNVETARDGSVHITQPPGPGNALGRIKFNFPNRFDVYLHDTPDKNLFAHDKRAYSHGCMRVQNPDQFGEVLASYALPGQGYSAAKLTSMYGRGEAWLNFKRKVPVHVTYMTAYVDDRDQLVVRDDVYGLDTRVLAALKGEDRDYGQEEVVARIKSSAPRKRVVARDEPAPVENFFSRLFR